MSTNSINSCRITATSSNKNMISTSRSLRLCSRIWTSNQRLNISTMCSVLTSTNPMKKWIILFRKVCSRILKIMWLAWLRRNCNSIIKLQCSCSSSVLRTIRCLQSSTIRSKRKWKPRSTKINQHLLKNSSEANPPKNKSPRTTNKNKSIRAKPTRSRKNNIMKNRPKIKARISNKIPAMWTNSKNRLKDKFKSMQILMSLRKIWNLCFSFTVSSSRMWGRILLSIGLAMSVRLWRWGSFWLLLAQLALLIRRLIRIYWCESLNWWLRARRRFSFSSSIRLYKLWPQLTKPWFPN